MKTTSVTHRMGNELRETFRRPWRLVNLFRPSAWRRRLRYERIRELAGSDWSTSETTTGLAHREFNSYENYLEVQQSKLEFLDLTGHEERFRKTLADRLRSSEHVRAGSSVLCLGARLGAEVYAFLDCGCFAIGVDLNPGQNNKVVLPGDFQNLVFANNSIDVVYTNSLDHSFDLSSLCGEVARVLKSSGIFIVEADPGETDADAIQADTWASLSWDTVDDLQRSLTLSHFEFLERMQFDYPRGGQRLILQKTNK